MFQQKLNILRALKSLDSYVTPGHSEIEIKYNKWESEAIKQLDSNLQEALKSLTDNDYQRVKEILES